MASGVSKASVTVSDNNGGRERRLSYDVDIRIHHGGKLVIEEGRWVYAGGTLESPVLYDEDKISRLEILREVWNVGYKECGPIYCKFNEIGKYIRLETDAEVRDYLEACKDDEDMIFYVDSPYDDLSKWERVDESERGAHIARATIANIVNMCINRTLNEETAVTMLDKPETPFEQEQENNIIAEHPDPVEDEVDLEEAENVYTDYGSDSEDSDFVFDEELEDPDASDAEVRECKKGEGKDKEVITKKKEQIKKFKTIELGPVGIDKGLESYIQDGNKYAGLIAGDEDFKGSSDIESVDSASEDDELAVAEHKKRSKAGVWYDPNCVEPIWELGIKFKTLEDFRQAVKYYAVKRGVHVDHVVNDRRRVRVTCEYVKKDTREACPWLLYASIDRRTGNFVIKNYKPVHNCLKLNTNKHCDAKFIAKYLHKDIVRSPNIKIWVMQDMLREQLKVYKGRTVCRRARDIVVKSLNGDYKEEFRRLLDYRDTILATNPGSTCVVDYTARGDPIINEFKCMYICFHALKEGFKKGCRKFIGLDGCFLKGVCKGQLLVAVAKNGNDQMFPIAWAVVHNENTESWSWFIEHLIKDLNLGRGKGYSIATDMQKGLDNAIDNLLPEAEHRMCARHIIANWSKDYRGDEKRKAFWRIVKSTFEKQLKENLLKLSELGGENIVPDLLRYNIERWCRRFITNDICCDSVDNNISETFNSWILSARYKSIISMLEEIRTELMRRHSTQLNFPSKWISDISPMAYDLIDKNSSRAMDCSILWNADTGYEVKDGEWTHVVNLKNNTCSCNSWRLKGIPCPHAIAAMYNAGLNPLDFVAHWYHKETFLQAYSEFLQPMPNLKMIPETNIPLEPPEVVPQTGRSKKSRRRPADELKKFGKASKKGTKMTCSHCHGDDHNIRKCASKKAGEPPKVRVKDNGAQSSRGSNTIQKSKKISTKSGSSKGKQKCDASITNQPNLSSNKKSSMGYGVMISERTGYTCVQNGKADCNRVISHGIVKRSDEVTGDLGFAPRKRKWKGKEAVTIAELKKQSTQAKCTTKTTKVTEEQKRRAAANKAAAQQKLAARKKFCSSQPVPLPQGSMTTSQSQASGSQPVPLSQRSMTRSQSQAASSQPVRSKIWKI